MAKELFKGTLSNGVAIELLEAESFSGKTEFAVKVAGEVASVSSVNILRTKDIQIKTTAKTMRVKPGQSESPPSSSAAGPSLDDI